MGRKAFKWALARGTVSPLLVDVVEPQIEGLVKIVKALARKANKKVPAYGSEEAFNFATPLGLVGPGVYQGDAQRGRNVLEMLGSIGSAVIYIQLSG